MFTRIMLLAALSVTVSACIRTAPEPPEDHPEHALLTELEAPPLNRPLVATSVKPKPIPPVRFQEDVPMLLVTEDGVPFTGQFESTGRVSVSDSLILFESDDERSFQILYRTPLQMSALRKGEGVGSIRLIDRSGPAAANRALTIQRERMLLMGEIWRSDTEPIRFEFDPDVVLQQSGSRTAQANGAVAVPLDVLYEGRPMARAPIGKVSEVRVRSGSYQIFVETSHLSGPTDPPGQFGDGYVLHAWVIRLEG